MAEKQVLIEKVTNLEELLNFQVAGYVAQFSGHGFISSKEGLRLP